MFTGFRLTPVLMNSVIEKLMYPVFTTSSSLARHFCFIPAQNSHAPCTKIIALSLYML